MHVTLLVPDLFWPRDDGEAPYRELELPSAALLLARARPRRFSPLGLEGWLCQAFEVERQHDWPVAPLTLAVDGGDAADAYWLRADPVHLLAHRDRLTLLDPGVVNPRAEDAAELVALLNRHFAGDDLVFHAPHPARWYVRLPGAPRLATRELSLAAGRDIAGAMPTGEDSLRWRRVLTEIQMLFHEHAVNQSREARGELPINSVWLWGGGTRPSVPGQHFTHVAAENAVAQALAARVGAEVTAGMKLPAERSARVLAVAEIPSARYGDDLPWRRGLGAVESAYLAPLLAGLRDGTVTEAAIIALHSRACLRFEVRRTDLLRFWRSRRPLHEYVPGAA
jgi:hypothetical protein